MGEDRGALGIDGREGFFAESLGEEATDSDADEGIWEEICFEERIDGDDHFLNQGMKGLVVRWYWR